MVWKARKRVASRSPLSKPATAPLVLTLDPVTPRDFLLNVHHHPQSSRKRPLWLGGKEYACSAGDARLVPGSGGRETPQEKEMTTHSGILAWEIPRTEGPGGYSPGGLKGQTLSD